METKRQIINLLRQRCPNIEGSYEKLAANLLGISKNRNFKIEPEDVFSQLYLYLESNKIKPVTDNALCKPQYIYMSVYYDLRRLSFEIDQPVKLPRHKKETADFDSAEFIELFALLPDNSSNPFIFSSYSEEEMTTRQTSPVQFEVMNILELIEKILGKDTYDLLIKRHALGESYQDIAADRLQKNGIKRTAAALTKQASRAYIKLEGYREGLLMMMMMNPADFSMKSDIEDILTQKGYPSNWSAKIANVIVNLLGSPIDFGSPSDEVDDQNSDGTSILQVSPELDEFIQGLEDLLQKLGEPDLYKAWLALISKAIVCGKFYESDANLDEIGEYFKETLASYDCEEGIAAVLKLLDDMSTDIGLLKVMVLLIKKMPAVVVERIRNADAQIAGWFKVGKALSRLRIFK
jgi:hypothetical protein